MSDVHRMVLVMDYEAENAARISGLCAMIALPMVRTDDGMFRRRVVEIANPVVRDVDRTVLAVGACLGGLEGV